jgi:hypothetical protein
MSGYSVAGAALLFVFAVHLSADPTNFSGHWQLQQDKSQNNDEEKTVSLDIQQQGSQIKFSRMYRERDGREVTTQFTCSTDGTKCNFDEDGHKANVSLWYDGPDLVVLKTNGDKRDSTVEWHLRLASDGKTLTVSREILEPSEKTIKLVFNRTESVAAR